MEVVGVKGSVLAACFKNAESSLVKATVENCHH